MNFSMTDWNDHVESTSFSLKRLKNAFSASANDSNFGGCIKLSDSSGLDFNSLSSSLSSVVLSTGGVTVSTFSITGSSFLSSCGISHVVSLLFHYSSIVFLSSVEYSFHFEDPGSSGRVQLVSLVFELK